MDLDTLYEVAIAGDASAIAKLEENANRLDENEYTILHTESKKGNTERVRFILREFANKNLLPKLTKYKHTALHLAIYAGHLEVAEVLIDAARRSLPVTSFQAFLRQGDKDLDTALHAAVEKRNVDIVKLLVKADPTDTHIQNNQGKTPLYMAVEGGYNDIVEIISTTCTAPSSDGPDGRTALRINNHDQVKSLGGTLYKIMDRDALYDAAIAGNAEAIAKFEIEADRVDEKEYTILHTESKKGNTERVRFILREFANKNLLPKLTKSKHTALHLAIYAGHLEVAEVLIDAARRSLPVTSFQAFLRQGDKDLDTALHAAVEKRNVDIVKLLVKADPTDTHIQNNQGKTPLYMAVEGGYNDIVEIISTTCTAPSSDGPDGRTALRINNHDQDTVKSPGGTLYKIMNRDALYDAAIAGNAEAIAKFEIEADKVDESEYTILHTESEKGNTERVRFILREFANKNLLTKLTKYKHTALHLAIYKKHPQVAEVLIDAARQSLPVPSFQAFLRQGDKDLDTALHAAVEKRNVDIVKLLVKADPTDRHIQNNQGKTPLYMAVEKRYNDIVEIISTTCTAPSLDGPDGRTALRINSVDQVKRRGGKLYKIMNRDALYEAAIAGNAEAIAKFEIEAEKVDESEYTILHTESKKGNTERVRFILREFANKNLLPKLTKSKHTALHLAIYAGHLEVAEVLIDAARRSLPVTSFQAFLRQGDKDLDTALHAAVEKRNVDIVKLLVKADPTDRHIQNNQGKTPLYMALEKGYKDILKVICTTCTALSNLDGPAGSSALHVALKNGYNDIEVVVALIGAARLSSSASANFITDDNSVTSFQAFLRRGDEDMNTALHIAVMQGNLAIAKLLVKADPSDPGIQNNKGETPFYIAVERGYVDIVKMICTTCTAAFHLDGPGGRLTALHAVIKNLDEAKNEVRDVIKMIIDVYKCALISSNGDLNKYPMHRLFADKIFSQTDEHGQTILELAVERNYVEVVELILNVRYQIYGDDSIGDDFISLMPLIYKAKDKGYKNIAKLLTERYDTGAEFSTDLKNQASFISAIRRCQTELASSLLDNHAKDLVTFADNLGWTALHHAAYNQFNSIISRIVEEQKNFEDQFLYRDMISTPFHVAAEKGYTLTVILLMQLWPSWSSAYIAVDKKGQNILHVAALQNKKEMIQGILKYCREEYKNKFVNQQDNNGNTPLHLLNRDGCFVPELMKYEGLDLRIENKEKWTPSDMLYAQQQIIKDQVRIRIALEHIGIDQKRDFFSSSVLSVTQREAKDVNFNNQAKLMIRERHARMKKDTDGIANCLADAVTGDPISKAALEIEIDTPNEEGKTILHVESMRGDTEHVRYIVKEFANRNLLVKLDIFKQTALHLAAHHGHTQVVEVLIDAAKLQLPSSSANDDTHNPVSSFRDFIRQANGQMGNTALHLAVLKGNVAIVKLLVDADPNDSHVQNNEGKTPIYIAAENGYKDIVKEICTTCTALSLDGPGGRTTALHALMQSTGQVTEGASDVIKMMVNAAKRWSGADFESLFNSKDELGSTVLQLAIERNFVEAVELILLEDPAYQHDRDREIKRSDLLHFIFKAIDNKLSADIIKLLSQTYEAGIINPDHKHVLALILAIKRRDEGSVLRLLGDVKNLVTFTDENGWTPLHYAVYYEFDSILGAIIEAQEDVGHPFVYGDLVSTPFHIAIKYGYTSTLVRLMQSWPALSSASKDDNSPYTVVDKDGRNILHLAAADNRKEMVQGILKYCPEMYKDKILKQQDTNGDTPLHLLISHGCFIPELINDKWLVAMPKNKNNFTPWEMLYFKSDVVEDQVLIKIAIDDVWTNQSAWNLWAKSTEKKTDIWKSIPPSKRRIKDVLFDERKKLLMDAKHEQKKKELERYKMRTNTQIIVTALITTVTFTVGFTMPGGLVQSGQVDQGLVVLSKKPAFKAFMVSDSLALLLSTSSLFFYFLESMNEDPREVSKLNAASTVLNIVSVMAMMLTFIAGTYLVLSHSPALALTVCIMGSLFFLLIIILLIKIVHDRLQVKKNLY